MKFKLFATAFAVSFALTACDSGSSSSDANEAVFDNSNPGQEQLATEVEKDSSSSEKVADKGKTSTDTTEVSGSDNVSESTEEDIDASDFQPSEVSEEESTASSYNFEV